MRDTDEAERLELALIENMARADLNPVEEARACATLVDDLGVTKEELGRRVGRSRAAVSNLIRLLELPDEVLAAIGDGRLSEGHGRALLRCKDHVTRRRLAGDAIAGGWSVRETEERARLAEEGGRPRGAAPTRSCTPTSRRRSPQPRTRCPPRSAARSRSVPRAAPTASSSSSSSRARASSWPSGSCAAATAKAFPAAADKSVDRAGGPALESPAARAISSVG